MFRFFKQKYRFLLVVVTEDVLSYNNNQREAMLNVFCLLGLFLVAFWLYWQPQAVITKRNAAIKLTSI